VRKAAVILALTLIATVIAGTARAGTPVSVTATGVVEFNQIGDPPLGNVNSGDPVTMTFAVDSDVFFDSPDISMASFSLVLGMEELTLQMPFPAGQTPYFVIRDNDPAVDGFFVSTNVDFPFGVPISQTGIFGQFLDNFLVTYEGDTLPSLDILDALGTYDFTGLTVFGWSIDDGPFQAMFIIFEEMTIAVEVMDDDGDGVPNEDDLCPDTMIPEPVPMESLGVNRWALMDDDGMFDTNSPPGVGPDYMFTIMDTAGCSCTQIAEMMHLGLGHSKFGCSIGVMKEWVVYVAGVDYGKGDGYHTEAPGFTEGLSRLDFSGDVDRWDPEEKVTPQADPGDRFSVGTKPSQGKTRK
jgi:hypothetical protein